MGNMKILRTLTIFCRFSHIRCPATLKLEIVPSFFLDILPNLFKNTRSLEELLSHFRGIFNGHEIFRRKICIHSTLNVVRSVNFCILALGSQKGVTNIVVPDEFNWNKVHPNLHIIDIFKPIVCKFLFVKYEIKLVTESNTSHTILHTENIVVDRVDASRFCAISRSYIIKNQLSVIDTREVEGTRWLRLSQFKAEWPCVNGIFVKCSITYRCAVHFWDDVVVIDVGHIFKQSGSIDVKRCSSESIVIIPSGITLITCNQVNGLHWVVKVGKIKLGVGLSTWLVLSLSNQQFMFIVGEELAFICIQVDVVSVNLWCARRAVLILKFDSKLNFVVLESHQWEGLGPIFTKEERDDKVITL